MLFLLIVHIFYASILFDRFFIDDDNDDDRKHGGIFLFDSFVDHIYVKTYQTTMIKCMLLLLFHYEVNRRILPCLASSRAFALFVRSLARSSNYTSNTSFFVLVSFTCSIESTRFLEGDHHHIEEEKEREEKSHLYAPTCSCRISMRKRQTDMQ